MNTEIYIKPYGSGSYSRIDLGAGLPLPVTYAIKDVRQPEQRQSFRTKELKIPGTAANNILFNHIFEVGTDCTFNVNRKADCYVIQNDSFEVLRGNLQLISIENIKGRVYYSCGIYAGLDDLFTAIKDKLLTGNIVPGDNLDFSGFDHTYNAATQSATWGAVGSDNGYCYPMIDYKGRNWDPNWHVEDFFPAIYTKQYVDKIFAKAGKTYTSNFFTSDFFKHLIIPFNKDKWKFSDAFHIAREFRAEVSSPVNYPGVSNVDVPFNNASTGTAYDPGGGFNTTTHHWTVPGGKDCVCNLIGNIIVTNNNGTSAKIILDMYKNGNGIGGVSAILNPGETRTIQLIVENHGCLAGDVFRIFIQGFDITIQNGSYFLNQTLDQLLDGVAIEINYAIPDGVLMSEFLFGLINMFNLYIEEDRSFPGNYLVEPRDDYYLTTVMDWSAKLDQDQGLTSLPMAELQAKRYKFRYKEDSDLWNDYYQKKYTLGGQPRTFGDWNLDVKNDWLVNEQSVEPIFAATQMAYYGRVVPEIVKWDGSGNKEITASKIRILYFAGLKASVAPWTYNYSGGSLQYTTYPYAGHLDEGSSAATLDLSFGVPEELQWGLTAVIDGDWYTDNNLFNKYWKNSFDEITDTNAKIVSGLFHLTPEDILNLSFRTLYYFEGDYWRLNQVIDYDLDEEKLTKCEFIKALAYNTHTPAKKTPGQPKPKKDGNGNVYDRGTAIVKGGNNFIGDGARDVIIVGSDNIIGQESSVIIIQNGSNNIIQGGLSGITLINTSNQTITDSNQLWINNCLVSGCINGEIGETPTGSLDGVNKDFALSAIPNVPLGVKVIIDGDEYRNGIDYTVNASTGLISFGAAPTGTWIFAYWR